MGQAFVSIVTDIKFEMVDGMIEGALYNIITSKVGGAFNQYCLSEPVVEAGI